LRIAYFDCFSGASGNMILGSLVHAGLDRHELERQLRRLPVSGWTMRAHQVEKRGLAALYLDVDVPGEDGAQADPHHHEAGAHRRLADVIGIVRAARFPQPVEDTAIRIYRRLAQAEAVVHGRSVEAIAFHEVGQIDAIVDIAGAALALHLMGVEAVHCSSLPCGTGRVHSAHGVMPSPAPATMELLRGAPTCQLELDAEFVTPTGAAILTTIGSFAARPPMTVESIGYGSGRSDFPFPNVLRVLIGDTIVQEQAGAAGNEVVMLETNIDDMNPELYEHVIERLFAIGALDVWTQAIGMKKSRPAHTLSVLAPVALADQLTNVVLAETTSIGVRRWNAGRVVLPRRISVVETTLGPVRAKVVRASNGARAKPEYDDCARIAAERELPLHEVMRVVERDVAAWLEKQPR